jgi:hypothetical protein
MKMVVSTEGATPKLRAASHVVQLQKAIGRTESTVRQIRGIRGCLARVLCAPNSHDH